MAPELREVHLTDFEREVFCYAKGHYSVRGAKGYDIEELRKILAYLADMSPADYTDRDIFYHLTTSVNKAFRFDVLGGIGEEYTFARMAEALRTNTVASLCGYIASTIATNSKGEKLYRLFSNIMDYIKF